MECLECISECVEHQKMIVNDVLDLSKLEVLNIEFRIIAVVKIIDSSIQFLRRTKSS